jgi:hypothetical protein
MVLRTYPKGGNGVEEIVKGDKIAFISENGVETKATCAGVTHGNLIHFTYTTEKGTPMAGFVGRKNCRKVIE